MRKVLFLLYFISVFLVLCFAFWLKNVSLLPRHYFKKSDSLTDSEKFSDGLTKRPTINSQAASIKKQQNLVSKDPNGIKESKTKTKVILYYTTLFGQEIWHGLIGQKLRDHFKNGRCKYDCEITYNKSRIADVDAVLFHARDLEAQRNGRYSASILEGVRKQVPMKQKWIVLSHENPQYDPSIYAPYKQLFNWTATFNPNSDIFVPYSTYRKSSNPKMPLKNYAQTKKRLVSWAVSNCGLMRDDYVKELERYIPVTVYGGCRNKFKSQGDCKRGTPDCRKELMSYKFYLAFENDFCEGWVSEKYWERIAEEVVPVVMGGPTDNEILAIPGSYIDTSKFGSIKALADYLHYLDSNDTAYNEYFAWKSRFEIDVSGSGELHCQICMGIHSAKFEETKLMTLADVFNAKKLCTDPYHSKYKMFVKQVEDSRKS